MIEFKWFVAILTITLSAMFIYLTGKEKEK
jgi:hypothetical protein